MSDDAPDFDGEFWQQHWRERGGGAMASSPPSPYLARELTDLAPGTALDAGCGAGAEAIWLAGQGWRVTGVDLSSEALTHAARRAEEAGVGDRVAWVEADLATWAPPETFDLVASHYAHASIPQLALYDRLASWVSPGGTLLLVGHAAGGHGHGHGHGDGHGHGHAAGPGGAVGQAHAHPDAASVTAEAVAGRLDPAEWAVVTAEEARRTHEDVGGGSITLHDVVVRATRRATDKG